MASYEAGSRWLIKGKEMERCFEINSGEHKGEYAKYISTEGEHVKLSVLGKQVLVKASDCIERKVSVFKPMLSK